MIGESPQALTGEAMASRIYSPFAYPVPRRARVVPVVSIEAERLAGTFPLVWRRGANGAELVALRSLLEDGSGFPPGADRSLSHLPLALQAYPFVFSGDTALAPTGNSRLLDAALADEPSDVGAAVAGPDGRLSRGAELRLRALSLFERDFAATAAIGNALAAENLLEPWPLEFDLGGGQKCDVPDLLVVAPSAFETPRLAPVLARLGAPAARLVGFHRLSLFRAGVLLGAARQAMKTAIERARP
ncbi:SapC family protein [Aureimonas psammosilenae]|uniref:SapC family protein n=1 Tax=Aureimonas psammosilenae TaxID=2495496 RepID=UPI001260F0A2|nr:SapC family protein [Aureimonas psammosilenae]